MAGGMPPQQQQMGMPHGMMMQPGSFMGMPPGGGPMGMMGGAQGFGPMGPQMGGGPMMQGGGPMGPMQHVSQMGNQQM
jgi:hypothetical protein